MGLGHYVYKYCVWDAFKSDLFFKAKNIYLIYLMTFNRHKFILFKKWQ